eukprot:1902228-Pyramimonas_sp.AAC.1
MMRHCEFTCSNLRVCEFDVFAWCMCFDLRDVFHECGDAEGVTHPGQTGSIRRHNRWIPEGLQPVPVTRKTHPPCTLAPAPIASSYIAYITHTPKHTVISARPVQHVQLRLAVDGTHNVSSNHPSM